MTGYAFTLDCRWCGGELEHLTESRPSTFDTRAVARCTTCRTVWTVCVQIITDTKRGACYASPAKVAQLAKARDIKHMAKTL